MDSQKNLHDGNLNGSVTPPIPPAPPAPPMEDSEPEPTFRQWLERNGFSLLVVGALLVFLFIKFDGTGLWAIAKAALGLSFVVFIHELGHFLVAKWCDVHVTTFSIGFGPPIPGCWFKWGETTYKLALFPLGGYVQMVGQVDGDEGSDGSSEDDPRSFRNKSVSQRMAIISAGVVMNVILAIVCFIVVFQGPGKDRRYPVIDTVESGSPAFKEGLRSGAVITTIGDYRDPYFENLMTTVMASTQGEKIELVFKRPQDAEATRVWIEPRLTKENTRPVIGILPASRLMLEQRRLIGASMQSPAYPHSAAAKAEPAFEFEDRIIACTDPDHPARVTDLPLDPRKPNSDQRDYFEFARRMKRLAGKTVIVRVERGDKEYKKTEDISVPPSFYHTFGTRMTMGEITALRDGSPAAQAGIQARDNDKRLQGDIIMGVEAGGKALPMDPLRLPFELQRWADALHAKKKNPTAEERTVVVRVRRHRAQPGAQFSDETIKIVWDHGWRFDRIVPFASTAPLAIPELGLAYQVKTAVAETTGMKDGLQKGDVIKRVRFHYEGDNGEKESGPWVKLEPEEFAWVFWRFQSPGTLKDVTFEVQRDKETKEIVVAAVEDQSWPLTERGLILSSDIRVQKASNIFEAVGFGLQDTYNLIVQVYQNLRGMITNRISVKNLGGPVMIAQAAYRIAGYDFWEFVFFIGMISVNLAVINFLPIPVLDGGHMVFLIYEKIRGKPASEGVRVGATYAGLALILSIMIFVLYQDISRLFRG